MVINNYIRILMNVWTALSGFANGILGALNISLAEHLLDLKQYGIEWELFVENGIAAHIIDVFANTPFAQDTTILTIMFGSGFTFYILYQLVNWFGNLID